MKPIDNLNEHALKTNTPDLSQKFILFDYFQKISNTRRIQLSTL